MRKVVGSDFSSTAGQRVHLLSQLITLKRFAEIAITSVS